jgi:ribosome-associated toxin RatA of RatAB toxin-antitoxin module
MDMNSIRINPYFRAWLIIGLLSIPTILHAANSISLDEHEKKRIAQGEIIVREIDAVEKSGRTFEAIGLINASANNVMQVLKDYKKYPDFMPNVSRIEIVEQSGNVAVLNYTLTLPLKIIKKYRLRLSVNEAEEQSSLIEWQMEEWPELKMEETIRDTSGYWRIEAQSENKSLALYHLYTDPGSIPFGLGWIVDVLSKNSVPQVLLQTKDRTEELSRLKAPALEPGHKK